jgi:hypothetical protein
MQFTVFNITTTSECDDTSYYRFAKLTLLQDRSPSDSHCNFQNRVVWSFQAKERSFKVILYYFFILYVIVLEDCEQLRQIVRLISMVEICKITRPCSLVDPLRGPVVRVPCYRS